MHKKLEEHRWAVELEGDGDYGKFRIVCLDPCGIPHHELFCAITKWYGEAEVRVGEAEAVFVELAPVGMMPACTCEALMRDACWCDDIEFWVTGTAGTPFDTPLPIELEFVDDSTPSGPWGPAEASYYIVVKPGRTGRLVFGDDTEH